MSEALRFECNIIDEFFDTVFGEGISQKLFEGKKDLQKHMELFKDITDAKNEATKSFQDLYNNLEIKTKYMPNRETRRYNKLEQILEKVLNLSCLCKIIQLKTQTK